MESSKKNKNRYRLFSGILLTMTSIPFFTKYSNTIGYFILLLGVSLVVISMFIFFKREPPSILKSKVFLWTLIPTLINFLLLALHKYFINKDQETVAYTLLIMMFIIAIIVIIRKLILKERLFWY